MATDETKRDPRTVWLKRVRLSFTEALKDKQKSSDSDDAKEKHSCNVIIEQVGDDAKAKAMAPINIKTAIGAIEAASEKMWKDKDRWKSIQEDAPKRICFRRGERFKNKEGKVYAGYEGNFGLTASGPSAGQKRPKLLDRHKRDVTENDILDVMYGGSYADVLVSFYGTDKGSSGVFASIELIRSHQEGEAMGGGVVINDAVLAEIDDLDDDMPAADDFGV
ncbi:ssDNA-binding protein [Sphingomonas sp. TREG-RG-20F-R18-01]|uniref:ssDNA-binding protein n=1 Tax=Sphingomonas sp. TREG-RG-20F-R18-01 TaxID=2914982 RepID=UPI001F5A4A7E|nr:ssDNA-binding protein [Sphingomonas sp. TREG-RG-20F-R18-01]